MSISILLITYYVSSGILVTEQRPLSESTLQKAMWTVIHVTTMQEVQQTGSASEVSALEQPVMRATSFFM